MGYDCTLHLVDEAAIRDSFVPKLLRRSRKKTALDRVFPDADELWDQVRDALDEADDGEDAAAYLCQLAVVFSACSLPHQYERGLALCLWEDQEPAVRVKYPQKFVYSPEELFAGVVAEYPDLHGQFPDWFISNGCTGVFIPSRHVPEVLAWAEEQVGRFTKGKQRDFRGLLGILRAAADKKLAYWEATDLAVPMANEFPGDPALMMAAYLGNEPTTPGPEVEEAPRKQGHFRERDGKRCGDLVVCGDFSPFVTAVWDFSAWPPRLVCSRPEFAAGVARSRAGRWLFLSETDPAAAPRTFVPRLFDDPRREPVGVHPLGKKIEPVHPECGFVGDRPVVFRKPHYTTTVGDELAPPLWWAGAKWVPLPGVPAATARKSALPNQIENPVVGLAQLADGSEVVIWDGDGYELRGKRFEKTFPLGAKTSHVDWTSVPAGEGFFYLSNRRLFEARRGKKPKPHVKAWTNIMAISPGPAGGIVLREGENDDGDVAKLYFPSDGTFLHIEPDLFDDADHSFIHWSESADRFVVAGKGWMAVRTADVLARPRHPVK